MVKTLRKGTIGRTNTEKNHRMNLKEGIPNWSDPESRLVKHFQQTEPIRAEVIDERPKWSNVITYGIKEKNYGSKENRETIKPQLPHFENLKKTTTCGEQSISIVDGHAS